MNHLKTTPLQKTIVSAAIAAALSIGATTTHADIYEFTSTGEGLFTMLDSTGIQLGNTSSPYYDDPTWGYGLRTQTSGTMTFETATGAGTGTVAPFAFFNGGDAVASGVEFQSIGSGLILGAMTFSWGAEVISTQIVLDGSGLFAEIAAGPLAIGTVLDAASCALSGACATPASDGIKKGKYPIGPVPVATSSYNTTGQTGVGTTLAQLSLGGDDGIGGSPMDNGTFADFNANFDFTALTVTGYRETTPPVITVGGLATNSITISLNDVFDPLNPSAAGYVFCSDATDGDDTIDGAINANISFQVVSNNVPDAGGGVANVAGDYVVEYTCQDNSSAIAAGTLTASDNTSNTATLNVTVNTPPVANTNYDQTLASDSPLVIDFTTTAITGSALIATDADTDTMTFSSVSATTNGGVVTDNGTDLLYTPAAGYVGADSFTYTVNDGAIDSGTGTVNLDVTNVLPVAVLDGASATVGQSIAINVVTNDTDYEDDINSVALSIVTITTPPVYGTINSVVGGTVNYTAPATIPAGGNDPFYYTVTDSNTPIAGVSSPVVVNVGILAAANAIPTTTDVAYTTDAGTPLDIIITAGSDPAGAGAVPVADTDGGDTHIFTNVAATSTNGTITGNNSDTLTYTPNAGFNGVDTFTFTATDNNGGVSTPANTITITVNSMVPVANDDPGLSMLLGGTLNIDVAANDTDVEDDATSTALVTVTPGTPDNGGAAVAVVAADGTIDFTPVAVGVESFTYTVTDSDSNVSAPATVTVTVTAAPVTSDIALATDEDVALTTISLPNVLIATDGDGDALTYDTFDAVTIQGGAVTVNGANDTLTYTPAENFNGVDTFTFSVTDGVNTSAGTSTVTMTVAAIDDAMVCQGASFTTAVDTPALITENDLVGACTDIDGAVTLLSYTQPTNGAVTGTDPLTYTPTAAYVGADSFTFTATDGTGAGDRVYTVTMAVVDDPAIHVITGGNFTMLDSSGAKVGGATDVSGVFDERLICNIESCTDIAMTTALASSQAFNSNFWTAHDIRVFGPGIYTFDSTCTAADIAAGTTVCGGTPAEMLSMTVGAGQLGAHMLFDWNVTTDIDVVVTWDYNTAFGAPIYDGDCAGGGTFCDATQTATRPWNWSSVDADGDSFRGAGMVDGPFGGFHANFNLDMTSGYTPPVANNDSTSTTPSTLVVIDLLANDSDAEDGAPPVGVVVTLDTTAMAAGSTLIDNLDGTVDYTPDAALVDGNTDTFQYTITDAGGAVSSAATVTVSITATLNTAPTANDVTFVSDEDVVLSINITDVDSLSTDVATDAESDPLTFVTFDAASTQGGVVTVDITNSILSYTPLANFNGTDTFTFSVNDGLGDSNIATMTITVNPVNDAVVCTGVTLATAVDTALTIVAATELITGCTDIDGDTVTFASAVQPANVASVVVDDGLGTLTYTPETGLFGSDSFVFTATDGNGGDGTATANIQVGTVYGNFTMLDASGNVFGGTNDVVFTWDGISMHSAETDLVSNMTIESAGPHPFFGAPWFAHHVRVFGPGTYTFEADNALCESKAASPDAANAGTKITNAGADDIDASGCPGTGTGTATTVSMTVAAGQIGVHMLFDYNGSFDIDVVNVYDMNAPWNDATGQGDQLNDLWSGAAGVSPDPLTDWGLVSRDVNADGVNGSPMIDGPFVGFYANFNDSPGGTAPPQEDITTEVRNTLLGSGVLNWGVLLAMLPLISLLRRRNK